MLTLHSGLLELTDQDWDAARIAAGLRDTFSILNEQPGSFGQSGRFENIWKITREKNSGSLSEIIHMLDRALEVVTKLREAKTDPAGEYETWLKIFDQNCREQQAAFLDFFPWLQLQKNVESILSREPGQE